MLRSIWKINPFFNILATKKKKFKIFNSNFVISKDLLGFIFFVYNGNKFKKVIINVNNIGFLLSSLVLTRFNDGNLHNKDKKKKKKKK